MIYESVQLSITRERSGYALCINTVTFSSADRLSFIIVTISKVCLERGKASGSCNEGLCTPTSGERCSAF